MVYVPTTHGMGPAYRNNKTVGIFHVVCKIIYFSCASNFWFEDMRYPAIFMKIYNKISQVLEVVLVVFIVLGWGPIYTQHNLTEKQNNDMYLYAFSHVVVYFVYANAVYYKQEIRELVLTLAVRLKEVCNDEIIEKMMVKTVTRYLTAVVFLCTSTLLSYGVGSGIQALTSNATFTTVIPIWPDVEDRRLIASIARIIYYIIWEVFLVRVTATYLIILTITVCLAHQFKNLCKYFEDLNSIFDGAGTQKDKEERYEDAFKVGIKMHSLTLWCIKQTQLTGGVAFSAQIVLNVSVLVLLMMQMMFAERSLMAMMPMIFMAATVLVGTGVFSWNAGDITIEASRLPTAMFHSGWHNCQKEASLRVRKMVTISINQAQKRVVINALGFIELSYESYVTIVKSAYSLFSVIY